MKLRVLCLFLILVFCLTGCQVFPKSTLEKEYNLEVSQDYIIDTSTNIGFKAIKYQDIDTHILGYLNEKIEVSEEEGSVKSLTVGKNCISITGSILSLQTRITNKIQEDLLEKLYSNLNNPEVNIRLAENKEKNNFYIISKNDNCLFIDYLTPMPENNQYVIYYRIIIQDISQMDTKFSEVELSSLTDVLPELLEILGIDIEILNEIPIK